MKFKRAVQRYGRTPEPVTPYQRAAQVWDERIGSARVQARNWRLMAFGRLFLSAGLSGGLAVAVAAEPGRSLCRRSRPARRSARGLRGGESYRPTDPADRLASGASSLPNVRSVSLDPVLMRAQLAVGL